MRIDLRRIHDVFPGFYLDRDGWVRGNRHAEPKEFWSAGEPSTFDELAILLECGLQIR